MQIYNNNHDHNHDNINNIIIVIMRLFIVLSLVTACRGVKRVRRVEMNQLRQIMRSCTSQHIFYTNPNHIVQRLY